MYRVFDEMAATLISLIILVMAASIFIWLIIIAVVGGLILRAILGLIRRNNADTQPEEKTAPLPPTRWFGAPPITQWLGAYDYWLYQLENVTGIDFTTSPERMALGAVIISLGPGVLVSSLVLLLGVTPEVAVIPPVIGLVVGLVTGQRLSQPASNWFPSAINSGQEASAPAKGIVLGEEDW